jgi:hypothetical protein
VRTGEAHRQTRDLDLLGRGDSSTARLERVFADLWALPVPEDGLALEEGSIWSEEIREAQEYGGVRVTMTARLGNARIPIQVDIGFGDAVTPGVEEIAYPTLLDPSAPRLLAYPMETVLAEKLQALVMLGVVNTRMKDFYDLWMLSRGFDFEGPTVVRAIRATFRRRQTAIPAEVPVGLTPEFGEDAGRQRQWTAFLSRTSVRERIPVFADVVAEVRGFLMPPLQALASSSPFAARWPARGPWTSD